MKKILLSLMLITSTHCLPAKQKPKNITLTQDESKILTYLNDNYKKEKLFYKKLNNADLTLSLQILSKKIQLLNEEVLPENSWRRNPFFIFFGLIPLSVGACFAAIPGQLLYKLHTQFIEGKFKDITLSFYLIERLSSTTISAQEKRYLRRFSFEDINFQYFKDGFGKWVENPRTGRMEHISQEEYVERKIANLSPTELEKIKFLALRSAITDLKLEAMANAGGAFIALTIGAFYSIKFFCKAAEYERGVEKELKTYKEIYKLIKTEQESHDLF